MTPDDKRHGSRAGYLAHRKDGEQPCGLCQEASDRYLKQYRFRTRNYTRPLRRPAVDAIALLDQASQLGLTDYALSRMAGVSSSCVVRIRANVSANVNADIVERL